MFDAARAVEVICRPSARSGRTGYGSGYCIGAGMIITCGHILPTHFSGTGLSVRDINRREHSASILWRHPTADVAILGLDAMNALPPEVVEIAELPSSELSGLRLGFVMFGWPRAGDMSGPRGNRIRDPVQVDGEIKLAEYSAAKSGLLRLRPEGERYPPTTNHSYWSGMSGAAVYCQGFLVGIQVQQSDLQLPDYLSAQPLSASVLRQVDDCGRSAARLLAEAGVRLGVTLSQYQAALSESKAAASSTPRARAARPYLLLETGEVVGRLQLRQEIADFQSASEGDASVMLLVGVAGVGKSALAWDLWKRLRTTSAPQGGHLFWYSFYNGRGSGSFQGLIDELSDFIGLRNSKGGTSIVSSDMIIDSLATMDTVLFLDGIERCLRCYQRPLAVGDLAAAQIQERNVNNWSMQDLAFASDEIFRFFIQLAELPKCRVIATSRVVPSDFFASGGGLRAGVVSRMVGGLDATETLHLLNAVGLSIGSPDAAAVAGTFGGHPLALQLFARQASRSVSARRDVSTWLVREGYSLAVGRGPAEIRTRLFAAAAARLSPDSRVALAATGAVGGAFDLPSLQEIMPSPSNDERVYQIIEEIAASGLGLATPDGLACHPLTASAAADQLTRTQTEQLVDAIGVSLRRRFKDLHSGDDGYFKWYTTGNVADRSEAMALCRALVRLSKWPEAAELYVDQLDLPVRLAMGANFDAIELLQQLISGLDSLSGKSVAQIESLRSRLAYHLLMTGQIKQADVLLASLEERSPLEYRTYCIASEVALHLGDSVKALRLATIALHEARGRLYYAYGYDHRDWGLITADFVLPPRRGPSADFIESVALCARVLIHEGYLAEASLLISEGLRVRREDHPGCDGCHGLLLRVAAELLLVSGDHSGAGQVADYGKNLQESSGKALQGLLSDVIVISGLCKVSLTPPPRDLVNFLSDTGFVLYQLILDAVAGGNQSGSMQSEKAIRELEQIQAEFALGRVISGRLDKIRSELSAAQVGQCVGWLIDDRAMRQAAGERQRMFYWPTDELSDELKLLDEAIVGKLDFHIRSQYPGRLLAKVARRTRAADRGTTRVLPDLPELRVAIASVHRLQALKYAHAGNHGDYVAALVAAHNLSLYNISILSDLVTAMVKQEEFEAAAEYLKDLLKTTPYYDVYDFAVTLVTSSGILADRVREYLIALAEDHHESCGAYLALANLERRIGDEKAAQRWHKKGLDYPSDTTAREEHRLAHIFGSQGRRTQFTSALSRHLPSPSFFGLYPENPPFGLSQEEYGAVAYLLNAVTLPRPVQNPGRFADDFFKAAQDFIISECSRLHVIGPDIVVALKAKFQPGTG